MHASRLVRRRPQVAAPDLCTAFCSLYIAARGLSTSAIHYAAGGSNNDTPNPMHSAPPQSTKRGDKANTGLRKQEPTANYLKQNPANAETPAHLKLTPEQRAAQIERKAKEAWDAQQTRMRSGAQMGGLADDSIFAEEKTETDYVPSYEDAGVTRDIKPLSERSPAHMVARLNPKPNARARWVRKMVIRDVRRRGRMTKEMHLARTERSHTSRSRFFETSVKKLAPLARQIAGKPIDEAILQMRFSKKKAAKEVLNHLVQARNEAIVVRGMGLDASNTPKPLNTKQDHKAQSIPLLISSAISERQKTANVTTPVQPISDAQPTQTPANTDHSSAVITDPSSTPPLATQLPSKALKSSVTPNPTDIYVAQAWVNRGTYSAEMSPRARGRADVIRHPHTGISVMLKEEKTRTREKLDKEIRAVRKRMNGKLWTALPDRPISRQSQYVLW